MLAEIVDAVFTIEIVEPLAARSTDLLTALGYDNIETRFGDGGHGENKPRSRESEPSGRSSEKKAGGGKARSKRSRAARA